SSADLLAAVAASGDARRPRRARRRGRRRRPERRGAVHRVGHSRLPRRDRPAAAGDADDLPGVHRSSRSEAALLGALAPRLALDRDADVEDPRGCRVVDCAACGGLLKPDVVFFGEAVPRDRVERAFALVSAARTLLVLGSSLTVMSGYRFVLFAKKQGKAVA